VLGCGNARPCVIEKGTVLPPEQVSQEDQPDICSMFAMVVPPGVGVGVGFVDGVEEVALTGEGPEPPHPEIKSIAAATKQTLLSTRTLTRMRVSFGGGTDKQTIGEHLLWMHRAGAVTPPRDSP